MMTLDVMARYLAALSILGLALLVHALPRRRVRLEGIAKRGACDRSGPPQTAFRFSLRDSRPDRAFTAYLPAPAYLLPQAVSPVSRDASMCSPAGYHGPIKNVVSGRLAVRLASAGSSPAYWSELASPLATASAAKS